MTLNEQIEARMAKDYAEAKVKWLKDNGFDENEVTYIYFPADSYEVKGELKAAGFKYSPLLMWHRDNNEGYEDKTISLSLAAVGEITAWGTGAYFAHCQETVQNLIREARPKVESEWAAAEKEKITKREVKLTKIRSFDGRYGTTYVYTFVEGKYIYVWFTAKLLMFEVGDSLLLSGTIKKLQEYEGEKQTIVTRCTIEYNDEVK